MATSDITIQEKNALKKSLFERFNIPPSSEYCEDGGTELLFRTVSRETCHGINDTCIKIFSEGDDNKKLVLRGCQSTLVKAGYDLNTNYTCLRESSKSECVTTCQQPLCNNSHGFNLILSLIILGYYCF